MASPLSPTSASVRSPSGSATAVRRPQSAPSISANVWYQAGCRAHDVGDLAAAVQLYTSALELDPRHLASWIARGVARKEQRKDDPAAFEAAIKDYTRALQLSPTNATTLLIMSNRANCLTAAGFYVAALADHNSALALVHPSPVRKEDACLWCNRGCTLVKLGRLDEALSDFLRASEVDGAYAVASYNAGLVYGRQGRIAECARQLTRAADICKRAAAGTNGNGQPTAAALAAAEQAADCQRQLEHFTKTSAVVHHAAAAVSTPTSSSSSSFSSSAPVGTPASPLFTATAASSAASTPVGGSRGSLFRLGVASIPALQITPATTAPHLRGAITRMPSSPAAMYRGSGAGGDMGATTSTATATGTTATSSEAGSAAFPGCVNGLTAGHHPHGGVVDAQVLALQDSPRSASYGSPSSPQHHQQQHHSPHHQQQQQQQQQHHSPHHHQQQQQSSPSISSKHPLHLGAPSSASSYSTTYDFYEHSPEPSTTCSATASTREVALQQMTARTSRRSVTFNRPASGVGGPYAPTPSGSPDRDERSLLHSSGASRERAATMGHPAMPLVTMPPAALPFHDLSTVTSVRVREPSATSASLSTPSTFSTSPAADRPPEVDVGLFDSKSPLSTALSASSDEPLLTMSASPSPTSTSASAIATAGGGGGVSIFSTAVAAAAAKRTAPSPTGIQSTRPLSSKGTAAGGVRIHAPRAIAAVE